jgi:hypothetical protein
VGRAPVLGTTIICAVSNLRVQAGTGKAPIEHAGGNAGRTCESQMFTIIERRKAGREVLAKRREAGRVEVLAVLAAMTGGGGSDERG